MTRPLQLREGFVNALVKPPVGEIWPKQRQPRPHRCRFFPLLFERITTAHNGLRPTDARGLKCGFAAHGGNC